MAEQPRDTLAEYPVEVETNHRPVDQDSGDPGSTNRHPQPTLPDAEEGLIDWEVQIEVPPPRPTQTVTIRFIDGGRRPIPISDDSQD